MSTPVYEPEDWLLSATRVLKQYVIDGLNAPNTYEVVMQFPGALLDEEELPLKKTIIHFEIDDIDERPVGMGDTPHRENYDIATGTVTPQWASVHVINFDAGIWASDLSGGTTSRMRARQHLTRLFSIPGGAERLRDYSDGDDGVLEVLRFTGGRNALDNINDQRLYRLIDSTLEIRVFSRTPIEFAEQGPAIEEIAQAPNLTIIG